MMLLFALIYLRNYGYIRYFIVLFLEPYQDNIIPDRITPPPPPIELEDGLEYEVVVILGSKMTRTTRRLKGGIMS